MTRFLKNFFPIPQNSELRRMQTLAWLDCAVLGRHVCDLLVSQGFHQLGRLAWKMLRKLFSGKPVNNFAALLSFPSLGTIEGSGLLSECHFSDFDWPCAEPCPTKLRKKKKFSHNFRYRGVALWSSCPPLEQKNPGSNPAWVQGF
jgi:hypothetical protein